MLAFALPQLGAYLFYRHLLAMAVCFFISLPDFVMEYRSIDGFAAYRASDDNQVLEFVVETSWQGGDDGAACV